jgi:serine/threonine protein kinase
LINIFSGLESVIFKKDNISIGNKGIKELNTGQLVSVVNPNDFQVGDFIGSGASGSVYLAKYIPTGLTVAIKSINIYDKDKRKQFKNDLKVLSENKSPYLVKFFGAFFEKGNVKLVLEFMNLGSLEGIIERVKSLPRPCIPEAILSKITKEVKYSINFRY